MGISVNDSKLSELARMISEWPGLVSGPADQLIEDALVLLDHLGEARKLVDVGSGGGPPGLPLKIARAEPAVNPVEAGSGKAGVHLQARARPRGGPGIRHGRRYCEDQGDAAGISAVVGRSGAKTTAVKAHRGRPNLRRVVTG